MAHCQHSLLGATFSEAEFRISSSGNQRSIAFQRIALGTDVREWMVCSKTSERTS